MRLRAAAPGGTLTFLLVVAAGCGTDVTGSYATMAAGVGTPSASAGASASTGASASAGATASPRVSSSPSVHASPSPELSSGTTGAGVVMDAGLLSLLPSAIGTAPVASEPDAFAEAIGDASFTANVDSAAFAVVVDGEDLASGVVAHLRPGVYSDAFFRDWRDSYDEGACGQAGGVAAHAEAMLGGRPVYITTCAGGLRVYHASVPDRDVIVSLFSVGERRFGEKLLDGLHP